MRQLETRLQETRKRLNVPWDVLERDYLLSWVLAGMGHVESLRGAVVFKGGTALKKCYFGDYRFSEDLDFSAVPGAPTEAAMERAIREACRVAAERLDEYAPVEITCERYTEKEPHPGGQEAGAARVHGTTMISGVFWEHTTTNWNSQVSGPSYAKNVLCVASISVAPMTSFRQPR